MFSLALAVFCVAACGSAAAGPPDDVTIVSEGADHFEAIIDVPEAVLVPGHLGERPAVRLDLRGWALAAGEGEPALPLKSFAVAVPEGENVAVSVTGEFPTVYEDVLLLPFWSGSRNDPETTEFPVEAASDEAYSMGRVSPAALYETRRPCYARDLRVLPIDVRPATYDPQTGELQVFRRLRIRVESRSSGGAPSYRRRDAGGWEEVYRAAALNYPSEMANRALRDRRTIKRGLPQDYFDDGNGWIALEVTERGMYSVTYEDLAGAGVKATELGAVDPSSFRLFNGGGVRLDPTRSVLETPDWMTEHAILVEDGGDGSFDPGDRVIFYGLGADGWSDYIEGNPEWGGYVLNLRTPINTYWLTWGGGFAAGAPSRMDALDGAPSGGEAFEPEMYRERVHVEQNRVWDPGLRYPGIPWERWWWQILKMTDLGGRVYRVTLRDVVTDQPCRLFARFWGGDFVWGGYLPHHLLELSFNGSETFRRKGNQKYRMDVDTTAVWAREGTNELIAEVPDTTDPAFATDPDKHRIDEVYFAWLELEYYRRLVARGDELAFDWLEGTEGPTRFSVGGFEDQTVHVFDVTDRIAPAVIEGAQISSGSVTFERELTAARRNYYVVAEGALRSPEGIRPAGPGALRARTSPVDYIIVTISDLMDAATTLADWRQGHILGITEGGAQAAVEVVDVQDIYDEFSWGMVDPIAIRNFLEYRFRSASAGERPPSYALMFGDANKDFRDFYELGVPNLVASFDEGFDGLTASQFSSDDFLVLYDGLNDRFMDMAIGRLCVETPGEALDLVANKIIAFETGAEHGLWRKNVLLAADDECVETVKETTGCMHTEQADDLSKRHIPAALDIKKVYMIEYGGEGCVDVSLPEARRDFIEAINEGAILVNYVGHGSGNVIAQERLFFADDVETLENEGRLGIFVTASCAVAKFDIPLEIGIAEGVVRNGSKGALAAYGATTLAFPTPNKELNGLLCDAILPRPEVDDTVNVGPGKTLGMSVVEAEAGFQNWYYQTPYMYVLIGDPASALTLPGTAYPSEGPWLRVDLDYSDTELRGGERDTLSGRIMDGDDVAAWFNGKVEILVEGAEVIKELNPICGTEYRRFEPYIKAGPTFFRGVADVSGGIFESSWITPFELVTGEGGRIRAFAWNDERDAIGSVPGLKVSAGTGASQDKEGPVVELRFEGGDGVVTPGSPLTVEVSDPSGVNLAPLLAENALFLRLYNDDLNELVDGPIDLAPVFTYEEGSSTVGKAVYALPAGLATEAGRNSHRIEVSASDNYSNRSSASLSFEVSNEGGLELSDVINYPNPFSTSTTIGFKVRSEADVVVKVYTVSGRHIRTLREPAVSGWGQVVWDGADSAGDEVSNGVYLYKVTATATDGPARSVTRVGKAVVMR